MIIHGHKLTNRYCYNIAYDTFYVIESVHRMKDDNEGFYISLLCRRLLTESHTEFWFKNISSKNPTIKKYTNKNRKELFIF